MIPTERDPTQKIFHISIYPLHPELIYLIPAIQLNIKPTNGDKLHVRLYLFTWVVQLEFI
jgi:hypothetical protein